VINPDQGLAVGQHIWIPVPAEQKSVTATSKTPSVSQKPDEKPKQTTQKLNESSLVSDYTLPKPSVKPDNDTATGKKDDPAYVVTLPSSNCEIQIWYNFQLVAIKKINLRWKEMGMGLIERAQKAHQMRSDARLNGRFMMQDRFEVAALRDRDNKKYGNPDGPTFEHMVAFGRENGLSGDRIYEGIIESSGHVQPVYKSSCVKR
jgi:hypothetical protein